MVRESCPGDTIIGTIDIKSKKEGEISLPPDLVNMSQVPNRP
jgi:hypothetical protein